VKSVVFGFDSVRPSELAYRPVTKARATTQRIPAFDYLRAFVIFLVVVHHAVMAYCTGGHPAHGGNYINGSAPVVDGAQWGGFNLVVMWNDGFFMPLMFLLAGLFVRPSLARKGLGHYLVDRALRLGVPLLIGLVTVVPLSYYAAYQQAGGTAGFASFWAHMVAQGPWPSGPMWFVGALLVFDTAAVSLLTCPGIEARVSRWGTALDRRSPSLLFAIFVGLAALAYLPLDVVVGPSAWMTAGPFGIQASRIGLYGFFFIAGMIVGADRLAEAFDQHWLRWPSLAVFATALVVALDGSKLPDALDGTVTLVFAAAMAAGLLALAVRFGRRRSAVGDSLSANAYGIYLLHWPIVIWLQVALLPVPLGPLDKGLLAIVVGFGLSWLAAALLRAVPGVSRVL
jgi:glucan biosynthesis protein C